MAKSRNVLILCFNVLKRITPPVSRLQRVFKIRKSNLYNMRTSIAVLATGSCCITLLMYYYSRTLSLTQKFEYHERITTSTEPANVGSPMKHISLKEIYDQLGRKDSEEDFLAEEYKAPLLIDNPGCAIPVFAVNYTKDMSKSKNRNCGERAIVLERADEENVIVSMQTKHLKKYMTKNHAFQCCYRFIYNIGDNPTKLRYGVCNKLEHGMTIKLETEFINVKCFENGIKHPSSRALYADMYAFTKKIDTTKLPTNDCKDKYNVLMVGIDSMSLPRLGQTMKRTINFFQDNFWLAYRGYHKVGDNTFPNLMAAFTGKNLSVLDENCSGKMYECNRLIIWSEFKEAGYVTAYGEDNIKLPDTFHDDYLFLRSPTDHYLRPLFLMSETASHSTVCTGKQLSSQHLLDFALDFTITYRKQPFFGFFWINSFSHNPESRPQEGDKLIENFLNRLSYTGVLEDTFVVLFSDHGIRFGEYRLPMESYYDERLPFLFIWTPIKFKAKHPTAFKNLVENQFKLVTPYDLYNTLMDINRLSLCDDNLNKNINVSEACPNCHSLFLTVSANRTCQDAAIHEKWCSCHKLFPLDIADPEGIKSTMHVVSHIKTRSKTVKTIKKKQCWVCRDLSLKKVLRIHFYYDANKVNLYHVVAFTMTPGDLSYEATVLRKGANAEIVGKLSFISPYKGLGRCTVNSADRLFCVCQEKKNCS